MLFVGIISCICRLIRVPVANHETKQIYNILYINILRKGMIFFSPFPLRNRGEIRTLHHVKERLSLYYAGLVLYEKRASLFVVHLIQIYCLFF